MNAGDIITGPKKATFYISQCQTTGEIKIGFTGNLVQRTIALKYKKLKVIDTIQDCYLDLEAFFRVYFKEYRIKYHDWFEEKSLPEILSLAKIFKEHTDEKKRDLACEYFTVINQIPVNKCWLESITDRIKKNKLLRGGTMKKKGDLADPLPGEIPPETETINPEAETTEAPPETKPAEEETAALPRIETHTETQTLKCILTEDELKQAAALMARANGEWIDAESTLKSVQAQYKAKIAAAEAVFSSEASKYRSGYEHRPVEVRVEFDHERGTVERFRTDTFEMIESRRMTTFEAQRKIRF